MSVSLTILILPMTEEMLNSANTPAADAPIHRFREEAMATHFECWIRHEDRELAHSAANLLFRELQIIESRLSRFRDGSDISRINRMHPGETVLISETCHECLIQAMELQVITNGVFDMATGGFMELLRDLKGEPVLATEEEWARAKERRSRGSLQIDPENPRVSCLEAGLQIDLGGIGKGFALEELSRLLEEMEVRDFLLSAGGSTLKASGARTAAGAGWNTRLCGAKHEIEWELKNACLSSSGFEVKGAHILQNGKVVRDARWRRVWVMGPHAALVDGLSTACFLMDREAILELMQSMEGAVRVWVETQEGHIDVLASGG